MAVPRCNSVFITGCNRGIGLEFVKQFLRLPHPPEYLFATCRSLQAESAAELKKVASTASNVHLLELDLDDFQRIKEVGSQVSEILQDKGLNLLLNNAGMMVRTSLENVTPEEMIQVFKTNTVSPLMVTKALLPSLMCCHPNDTSYPKAFVLNVSSIMGSVVNNNSGGFYSYRASKCALNIITKSMSEDLKGKGISTVLLHPGHVKTDMGGEKAPVTLQDSVTGLMGVIGSLDESMNGTWLDYKGKIVPW